MRRRVKEQLKKLGGMEFYDVNFSYIDLDDMSEHYVSVPEQGGGKLIPEGMCNPGQVYTVSRGKSGMLGVFRLETQMLPGNGKFERTGLGSDRAAKESSQAAFNFLKANGNRISGSISTIAKDYIINYQDLQGIGMTGKLALPSLIALCSIATGKPVIPSTAVLGKMSITHCRYVWIVEQKEFYFRLHLRKSCLVFQMIYLQLLIFLVILVQKKPFSKRWEQIKIYNVIV